MNLVVNEPNMVGILIDRIFENVTYLKQVQKHEKFIQIRRASSKKKPL